MIPVLIDAALRSLFVGLIVACGMRAFRIRNVFAQKAALGLVLVSALSKEWSYFFPPGGGKVVYCVLEIA